MTANLPRMTEWRIQEALTRRWVDSGVRLGDEKLVLLAWEVMVPSWRINDARKYWAEPSIDFVCLDSGGRLVAIELKREVPGIKPAWSVLCQVTHRATQLARTADEERIGKAFTAARSGEHGRVTAISDEGWQLPWRRFFRLGSGRLPLLRPVRRVVAAISFGPSWQRVVDEFNAITWDELIDHLESIGEFDHQDGREARRLRDMAPPTSGEIADQVEWAAVSVGTDAQ